MINMSDFSFSGYDSDKVVGIFSDSSPIVTGDFSSSSDSNDKKGGGGASTTKTDDGGGATITSSDIFTSDWSDATPNLKYTNFLENIGMSLGLIDKTPGYWADTVITAFNNEGAEAAINKVNYLNQSGISTVDTNLIANTLTNLQGGGDGSGLLTSSSDKSSGGGGASTNTSTSGNQLQSYTFGSTPVGGGMPAATNEDSYLAASGAGTATYGSTTSSDSGYGNEFDTSATSSGYGNEFDTGATSSGYGNEFDTGAVVTGDPSKSDDDDDYLSASGAGTATYGGADGSASSSLGFGETPIGGGMPTGDDLTYELKVGADGQARRYDKNTGHEIRSLASGQEYLVNSEGDYVSLHDSTPASGASSGGMNLSGGYIWSIQQLEQLLEEQLQEK